MDVLLDSRRLNRHGSLLEGELQEREGEGWGCDAEAAG